MLLIPVFVALFMIGEPLTQALSALIFVVASVTDWMDGWYARKHRQETDFGKLMDPMADKLLSWRRWWRWWPRAARPGWRRC